MHCVRIILFEPVKTNFTQKNDLPSTPKFSQPTGMSRVLFPQFESPRWFWKATGSRNKVAKLETRSWFSCRCLFSLAALVCATPNPHSETVPLPATEPLPATMPLAVLFKIKSVAAWVNIEMIRSNVKLSLSMHVLFAHACNAYMHAYVHYIFMHVVAFCLASVLHQSHLRVAETLISFCSLLKGNQKFSLSRLTAWPRKHEKKQKQNYWHWG